MGRFPELQEMKPREKSPWSPVSHQPHDDAHPASSVTSTRESRATPSGFPFCFLMHCSGAVSWIDIPLLSAHTARNLAEYEQRSTRTSAPPSDRPSSPGGQE